MGSNGQAHGRLLIGVGEITGYLKIGKPMFHELRKQKLPVRLVNGRWMAHADNLDEYFRRYTLVDSSSISDLEGEE